MAEGQIAILERGLYGFKKIDEEVFGYVDGTRKTKRGESR
jgi:hypothetical protein